MKKTSKRRALTKRFKINGLVVECTTAQGLADIVGKSKDSILRYEELGIIPDAPLRVKNIRYYPLSLCERLKPIVDQFKSNRPPSAELQVQVTLIFNDEKQKLLCQSQKE